MPNWDIHWDYKARKPKNLEIYRRKKKQEKETKEPKKENGSNFSRFSKFFGCFISSKRSKTENFATYIDEDADTDEEIQSICRNKSLLLVILWKKGIPPWIRKTLWPIVIGNRLEVI